MRTFVQNEHGYLAWSKVFILIFLLACANLCS